MCGPGLVGYLKCHTMLAMHMFGDTLFGLALQLGTISLLQCSKRCSWKSATACARNFSWARNRNVWNLIIVLASILISTAQLTQLQLPLQSILPPNGSKVKEVLRWGFEGRHEGSRWSQTDVVLLLDPICHWTISNISHHFLSMPMPSYAILVVANDLVQIRPWLGFRHLQSILLKADCFEGYIWTIPCMAGHWATGSRLGRTLTGLLYFKCVC